MSIYNTVTNETEKPPKLTYKDMQIGEMFRFSEDATIYMRIRDPDGTHKVVSLRSGDVYSVMAVLPVTRVHKVTIARKEEI